MVLQRAYRLLKHPARAKWRLDLWNDYGAFTRQCGFLSHTRQFEDPARRVLIVSLSNWIAQIKIEALMAAALRLRGWTPYVLTYASATDARRYFLACGIDRFVFLDQLLEELDGAVGDPSQVVESLLSQHRSFRSLLVARYRDVELGRHVLSTLVRQLRCGRVDVADPHVAVSLRHLLPASIQAVVAAERVVDQVKPQLALFLEKGYSPYGEVFDVAVNGGLNVVQWVHSHRSDALMLKRYQSLNRHLHPFSISSHTWETIKDMPWTAAHEHALDAELSGRYREGSWFSRKFLNTSKRIKSSEEVRQQLGLDPHKNTAVIFSHVLWDATFFFGENLFDDYEEWLIETVKAACHNEAVNWIVKIHPDYVWKLKAMGGGEVRDVMALEAGIGRLPGHVKLLEPDTDISTFSLFEVMDYCLTVRGTVGIEASCFGIPVLTAGTGRYSGLGFTIDSATRQEYLGRLACIQTMPRLSSEHTRLAKQHAYALFKLRPWPFTAFETTQQSLDRLGRPLDHNVIVRARSVRELREAPDLRSFVEWVEEGQQEDFLVDSLTDESSAATTVSPTFLTR